VTARTDGTRWIGHLGTSLAPRTLDAGPGTHIARVSWAACLPGNRLQRIQPWTRWLRVRARNCARTRTTMYSARIARHRL